LKDAGYICKTSISGSNPDGASNFLAIRGFTFRSEAKISDHAKDSCGGRHFGLLRQSV
jgi:hypothetical protein